MEFLNILLPVLLYIFGIILLIVLIILGIRTIELLDKINKLTDDINDKVSSLDNLFSVIDRTTDGISLISEKIINSVSNLIINLVSRKRKGNEEDE